MTTNSNNIPKRKYTKKAKPNTRTRDNYISSTKSNIKVKKNNTNIQSTNKDSDIDFDAEEYAYEDNYDSCDSGSIDSVTIKEVVKKKRGGNNRQLNFGQENIQPGDNTRYVRHALAAFNLPAIDISDDKQVEERISWFFQHCADDDMKPTVLGLCNALGISKDTINMWNRGVTRGATHSDLIKKTYQFLEQLWESYMMNGKINPVSGIFLGRNHWGYQDKIEVQVTTNNVLENISDQSELAQRYKDSLPTEATITCDVDFPEE